MLIREANKDDAPFIMEIMNDAILNTTSIYDYGIRSLDYVENWLSKKKADNMPVLIVEMDTKQAAYGSYGIFRPWDAYKYSVEHSIYVHGNFQGQGIGSKLLSALIERALNDGYHTMIAGIDSSNQKSLELHKKLGFEETGRLKEVGFKFDKWLDLIFMQLILKNQ
jgi:L-amino acid N-acyltransferase